MHAYTCVYIYIYIYTHAYYTHMQIHLSTCKQLVVSPFHMHYIIALCFMWAGYYLVFEICLDMFEKCVTFCQYSK